MDAETSLELLRAAIIVAAMLSLSWLVARWTWLLVPMPAPVALSFDAVDMRSELFVNAPEYTADIQRLRTQSLFGQSSVRAPVANPPAAVSAAKKMLGLQLVGLVYSSNPNKAVAVIKTSKKPQQKNYYIGDELPGSSVDIPITLVAVELLQVRILHGEEEEVLKLHDSKKTDSKNIGDADAEQETAKTPLKAQVLDLREKRRSVEIASRYAHALQENPASLKHVIHLTPARLGSNTGELIGFRVRPKQNARDFYQLGLRANDVITAVNGVDLTSYAALQGAQSELQGSDQVSVYLLRKEKPYKIILGLKQ